MCHWLCQCSGPATPPNPDDPAQFAKDYFVDITALDINFAVAAGSAWTTWVAAERAADTIHDNGLINAEYQLGVDQLNASQKLATSQVVAEDAFAGDMIDMDADYAIAGWPGHFCGRVAQQQDAAPSVSRLRVYPGILRLFFMGLRIVEFQDPGRSGSPKHDAQVTDLDH